MKSASLPLGLDIGATRVRLAFAERSRTGAVSLRAVAARDVPVDTVFARTIAEPALVAAIVDDLRDEIGTRERRCVVALPSPVALLRPVRFPAMRWRELHRAARFEAERFAWDASEGAAIVRVHPVDEPNRIHAVGIARADALGARVGCVRRCGLRAIAVDHEAYAFRRAFPSADAVLDVGHRQATLHAFAPGVPVSSVIAAGAVELTRAIAADLQIDDGAAERRKRILGTAGAGETARDGAVDAIAAAIAKMRERLTIRRITLTGNGSRLPGLAAAIAQTARITADVAISPLFDGGAYPDDVIRAASPDWTLAAALASWGAYR